MNNVSDLTAARLRKNPVIYTIVIRHDHEGMTLEVNDVQIDQRSMLAVAGDLEAAATAIREKHE